MDREGILGIKKFARAAKAAFIMSLDFSNIPI